MPLLPTGIYKAIAYTFIKVHLSVLYHTRLHNSNIVRTTLLTSLQGPKQHAGHMTAGIGSSHIFLSILTPTVIIISKLCKTAKADNHFQISISHSYPLSIFLLTRSPISSSRLSVFSSSKISSSSRSTFLTELSIPRLCFLSSRIFTASA